MNPKTEIRPTKQARPRHAPGGRVDGEVTLTPRQRQVAELVAKGLSNAEIAVKLGITKATVRWELRAIHRRIGRPLRLVWAAVLAVGLVLSGPAAAEVLDTDDEPGKVRQPATPAGGGVVSSLGQAGEAGQSAETPGSAKKLPTAQTPSRPLSPREEQVRKLASQGYLNKTIADELGLSQNTVDTYWRRIYKKTGKHDRKILFAQSDSLSVT